MGRIIRKVAVGALLLTTIATSTATPVYAATVPDNNDELVTKYNNTITQNYEVSVENTISSIRETIKAIETMGEVESIANLPLTKLIFQIEGLDRDINLIGEYVSKAEIKEIENVIFDTEKILLGVKDSSDGVKKSLAEQGLISLAQFKRGQNYIKLLESIKTVETVESADQIESIETVEETNKKAVKLSDISKHWGKKYIDYLVNKGGIDGYPDGTFKPDKTISKAEFLSIALRSFNGGVTPERTTDHWASGLFADAIDKHILMQGEMPASEWNKPITRYEMTVIMVRILQEITKEEKVSTSGVQNLISDYLEVSKEAEYKYYVEQAYMKGLIAGFSGGRFGGKETGTRAQAATMVVRMLDKAQRETVNTTPTNPATATGVVLKQDDPYRALPKAGDKFITADGREVILKIHDGSGVLGAYQNVSLYEGMACADGTTFKAGDLGTFSMGYAGQPYYIDKSTGTGMFREDWDKIQQYELQEALKVKAPKEGQIVGEWTQYKTMGKGTPWELSDWCWIGPVIK